MNACTAGIAREQSLALDDGRGADDPWNRQQLPRSRPARPDAARLQHVDVGRRTDDAVAQLALEAGHQRQRDEQSHDADHHAETEISEISEMNACFRLASR